MQIHSANLKLDGPNGPTRFDTHEIMDSGEVYLLLQIHNREDNKLMTNQQAVAKAKKRWGNRFYVRNGEHFSSPEQRQQALSTVQEARAEAKRIDEEITRRLSECDWYQQLDQKRRALRKQVSDTAGYAMHYRFSVGKQNGMFNEVLGQGDTWEEAFAEADKRERVAA